MKVQNWLLKQQFLLFFIFCAFFPTLRLFLIGSEAANTLPKLALSMLPEIVLMLISIYFLLKYFKGEKCIFSKIDYFILAYVLYNVVIGTILASNLTVSVYAIRMTYLPMIFYFIFSLNLFTDLSFEILVDKIFRFFVLVGFLGLVLYFVFPNVMFYFLHLVSDEIGKYFIIRMTSIFWTPVLFGFFMSCTAIYFSYKLYIKESKILYIYLIIVFLALFFSVSRGAIIATILGLITLSILSKQYKIFLKILLVKIFVFLIFAFYVSNPFAFSSWMLTSSKETIDLREGVTRVELWKQAFNTAKEHPLGLGLGKAGHVAERFFKKDEKNVSVTSTDGWFLKLLNETGLIGLLSYLTLSAFLFLMTIKYIRKNNFDIVSFIFVIFIISNITNLVSNVLDFYLFAYLYWMLIGILVYKLKTQTNNG